MTSNCQNWIYLTILTLFGAEKIFIEQILFALEGSGMEYFSQNFIFSLKKSKITKKYSSARVAKTIGPMKKFSRTKKFQDCPNHSFFIRLELITLKNIFFFSANKNYSGKIFSLKIPKFKKINLFFFRLHLLE